MLWATSATKLELQNWDLTLVQGFIFNNLQHHIPENQSSNHTDTKNHRIVGVGRDLWRSSSPTPLPKHVHPEQAAQDLIQAGFEYLQRRRLHNLSGELYSLFFLKRYSRHRQLNIFTLF